MDWRLITDPCGSVPRLFQEPLGLLTICRKGRRDVNKSGGQISKQTHYIKQLKRMRPRARQRKLLQVLSYHYESKNRRGEMMRKMTLPLKGLIEAMLWLYGIDGVRKSARE